MSFKRDGDDSAALNYQRKQRVAELLYEDIGDDEVSRLSNGKFTCKICKHRPIFDTINMFYIHKQGKKHSGSLEYAAQQKQEVADLVLKRSHEEMTQLEASHSAETNKAPSVNLGTKKQKTGRYDRRKVVDLDHNPDVTMTTKLEELPGNRDNPSVSHCQGYVRKEKADLKQEVGNRIKTFNEREHNSKEKWFRSDRNAPYPSKNRALLNLKNDDTVIDRKDFHKLVGGLQTQAVTMSYHARKNQKQQTSNEINNDLFSKKPVQVKEDNPRQTWDFYRNFKGNHHGLLQNKNPVNGRTKVSKADGTGASCSTSYVASSEQMKEKAEKMLQAFGSGWKKDWTGKWVREEDAEFDSDEEPPDV